MIRIARSRNASLSSACLALLVWPLLAAAGTGDDAATEAFKARYRHRNEVVNALQTKVLSECGLSSGSASYPAPSLDPTTGQVVTENMRFEVTGWTGNCASGLRSGSGTLQTRETTDTGPGSIVETSLTTSEGRFIAGRQQGLWCITAHPYLQNGAPTSLTLELGCRLRAGDKSSAIFRKGADGRWEQVDGAGRATVPPVVLAAGMLEQASDRVIADALAGKTEIALPSFNVQSDALDGLVAGTHIRAGVELDNVSLKGKRVALMLSNRTMAEVERYTRERQALLDAPVPPEPGVAEQRQRFAGASAPDRLLARVADALRRAAREVVPVDDLTGLTRGEFDYALVLDWQTLSRLDLLGKYQAVPPFKDSESADASRVAGQKIGAFLIDPKLQLVHTYAAPPTPGYKYGDCQQTRKAQANTCNRDYFQVLADFYEAAWNDPNAFNPLNYWFH